MASYQACTCSVNGLKIVRTIVLRGAHPHWPGRGVSTQFLRTWIFYFGQILSLYSAKSLGQYLTSKFHFIGDNI